MPPYKTPVRRRRKSSPRRATPAVARGSRGPQGLAGPRSSGGSRSYRRKARGIRRAMVPVRAKPPLHWGRTPPHTGVIVRRPRTAQEKGPTSVRQQAQRARPKRQTPMTRPIGSEFTKRGLPKTIGRGQREARARHERAVERGQPDPRLPIVPRFTARFLDTHDRQRNAVLDTYRQAETKIRDDLGLTKPGGTEAFIRSGFKSVPEYIEATHSRDDLAGYHAAAQSQKRVNRAFRAELALAPHDTTRYTTSGGIYYAPKPDERRAYRRQKREFNRFQKAPLAEKAKVGRRLEVAEAHDLHHGEAQKRTEPKQQAFGFTGVKGIPIPRLDWTAGKLLDQAARPLHGVANTALAAQQGKPLGRAFVRGLANKDKTTFGDVLEAKGTRGAAKVILGTAGDVLFDPLNLITVGRKTPATVLENLAQRTHEAADAARAAGNAHKAEELTAKARDLAEQAKRAPQNKGLQLGLGSPVGPARVSTSGALTARASKKLGVSGTARYLREGEHPVGTLAQGVGRTFNPRFRPRDIGEREWEAYLDANAAARARSRTGAKRAERVGMAFHRALKPEEGREVIDAIENDVVEKLPDKLQPIAHEARRLLDEVADQEVKAGILEKLRSGYVPHQWTERLSESRRGLKRQAKLRHEYAEARDVEGTIRQINEERAVRGKEPLFSENLAHLMTRRLAKSAERIAENHRIDEIAAEVARPVTLPDTREAVAAAGRDVERHNENFWGSLKNMAAYHGEEQKLERTVKLAREDLRRLDSAGDAEGARRARQTLDDAETNLGTLRRARQAEFEKGSEAERRFHEARARGERAATVRSEVPLHDLRPVDSLYRVVTKPTPSETVGFKALETDKGEIDVAAARKALEDGERVVAMPRIIGQMEARAKFRKADAIGEYNAGAAFDRFLSKLKTTLTVLNVPAYDLRNLTGDLFNAYLADTDARSVATAFRLVGGARRKLNRAEKRIGSEFTTDRVVKIRNRRVRETDLLRWADEDGVTGTGHVGGERFELARAGEGVKGRVKGFRPVESLRGVGEARENVVRLATYLSALRRGMTRKEAARWANKHHFDYNELTDNERTFLRRLFPFYTFASRNTQLQASKLFSRPGKYVNYEALRQELAKDADLPPEWEQELQNYQQRGAGIPLKAGGRTHMFYPGLPLLDLNRLAALADPPSEAQLTIQNVNPLVKTPIETLVNYNFFFREAIYRTKDKPDAPRWVPAPGWAQWAQDKFGVDLGVVMKPQSKGRGEDIPKWPALMDYFARLLPQSNFATQVTTSARGSHGQTSKEALFSQLTGVKAGTFDEGKNALNLAYNRRDELQAQINDATDSGEFHKAKVLRKQQSRVQDRIRKLRKGQGLPVTPKRKRSSKGSWGAASGFGGSSSGWGAGSGWK